MSLSEILSQLSSWCYHLAFQSLGRPLRGASFKIPEASFAIVLRLAHLLTLNLLAISRAEYHSSCRIEIWPLWMSLRFSLRPIWATKIENNERMQSDFRSFPVRKIGSWKSPWKIFSLWSHSEEFMHCMFRKCDDESRRDNKQLWRHSEDDVIKSKTYAHAQLISHPLTFH